MALITLSIITSIGDKKADTLKEPLFCSSFVERIVGPFMPESEDIVLKGSSEELQGSKARRENTGRVPDLFLCVNMSDFNHAFFISEVKSLSYRRSDRRPSDPDFVKMVNEIKDGIDCMGNISKECKTVYALLVQGDRCRIFALDLQFYKLYRLNMLKQFYLPVDKFDMQRLDGCYSALSSLKVSKIIT
ncbi:uncharacterized protein EV154DRAFT_125703 [Mucor mucedo]|uniref:uncharacterized protein n=1 Tax=Mucor mucedo TaxID=29922 RepID=UPI00221FE635|nr:uncharacterized protein EV154DRAFT_125703 [Mucor mucedo]KAI7893907.1 hypothetical protein EV154DRAFT_125703 [Mucor mucedo]